MGKKLTLKEVLERFQKVHGDRYSYELIKEYHNQEEKLPIVCKIHGVFYQSADKHFTRKQGCPLCDKSHKMNTEEFIERAKKVHGDKYSYPDEYVNSEQKIRIICPVHGTFFQTPHQHLRGQGCMKCYGNENKTTEQYIAECRKVHGDKYDYSKTVYENAYSIVTITCPLHGDFLQIARTHLYGHGCPECSGKRKFDKDFFIKKAKEIHGDRYDYSLIRTIDNNRSKVPIICNKHGLFYQSVDSHINQRHGCPKCIRSTLEEKVATLLTQVNIKYEEQKKFKWLGAQRLDFYLPDYNLAIECQGVQHFGVFGTFGGNVQPEEQYKLTLERDERKNKLCKKHNVILVYYAETDLEYKYPYLKNPIQLLQYIYGLQNKGKNKLHG